MISRWPLRSGLAVADGLVYCSGGMWPSEKTFMCALKTEDGSEAWRTSPVDFGFGAILNSSEDGKTRVRRDYKYATRSSYRILDLLCTVSVGGGGSAAAAYPLGALGPAEDLMWGNLSVLDEVLLGSVLEQADTPDTLRFGWDFSSEGKDFTGPAVADVLNSVGVGSGARCIFALDKDSGKLRWTYMARHLIPHTGICVLDDRVYLMDRPALVQTAWEHRRGGPPEGTAALVVLDPATGRVLRELTDGMADYAGLRAGRGLLLVSSTTGMTAFDAQELKSLWSVNTTIPQEGVRHCPPFLRTPVITKDWVFDDPYAYEPRTGKQRTDPSRDNKSWVWENYRGCGTVGASESLLFFRSGMAAVVHVTGEPAHRQLTGTPPVASSI
jgi:outer membrane protein assembly factor BamB